MAEPSVVVEKTLHSFEIFFKPTFPDSLVRNKDLFCSECVVYRAMYYTMVNRVM